jgi:anhydro-N-acetylmuramic acid kinase
MNPSIAKLYSLSQKSTRLIIGLMSGTSLDGLDIALCKITGAGNTTQIDLITFETIAYADAFKREIKQICFVKNVDLEKITILNNEIGRLHANYINTFLSKNNIKNSEVDLIASHGQTIYHSPKRLRAADNYGNATLQIGDADQIAVNTGIITLADFRQKNIAQGAEGAPLALYGDYLLFKSDSENRVLLNIGGIANFTIINKNAEFKDVISSDVGPGNTLMDQFIQHHFPHLFYDENAELALQGIVNEDLLFALLNHPFFEESLPKTTGPELFNLEYLEQAIADIPNKNLCNEDIMATLNFFSAKCIVNAIKEIEFTNAAISIYLSGGGAHNPLLITNLKTLLSEAVIQETSVLGVHPDAKEAILFALLANETVSGNFGVFGEETLSMGKICLPY